MSVERIEIVLVAFTEGHTIFGNFTGYRRFMNLSGNHRPHVPRVARLLRDERRLQWHLFAVFTAFRNRRQALALGGSCFPEEY